MLTNTQSCTLRLLLFNVKRHNEASLGDAPVTEGNLVTYDPSMASYVICSRFELFQFCMNTSLPFLFKFALTPPRKTGDLSASSNEDMDFRNAGIMVEEMWRRDS